MEGTEKDIDSGTRVNLRRMTSWASPVGVAANIRWLAAPCVCCTCLMFGCVGKIVDPRATHSAARVKDKMLSKGSPSRFF